VQQPERPKCSHCEYVGEMEVQAHHGCTSVSWIICLLLFTGLLFWIPLVRVGFKDKVSVCPGCGKQFDIEYA